MNKAVFLDRDGTINEDVGDLYSPDQLVFIPHAINALKLLQDEFLLLIVTNQSGIGRGVFSESQFSDFDDYFHGVLNGKGIKIQHTYCCPHTKEKFCVCRKPNTHFLEIAQKRYEIDLSESYVIGDHPHDIEMGCSAGMKSVYVLTGHGKKHRKDLNIEPNLIAPNLWEAATWIMQKSRVQSSIFKTTIRMEL